MTKIGDRFGVVRKWQPMFQSTNSLTDGLSFQRKFSIQVRKITVSFCAPIFLAPVVTIGSIVTVKIGKSKFLKSRSSLNLVQLILTYLTS